MNKFIIRNATPQDTAILFDFIHKMAQYEKLESEMDTSVEALHQALFVEHQAEVVIGEKNGVPVGFALFFHNFSTFKGQRGLYLEELFVEEPHRGKGYGKALLLHLVQIAVERKCRRMDWLVLDWNAPAIAFYKSLGAIPLEDWTIYRLTETQLHRLLKE